MAEGVWNKKLMVVALLLGLLAVILFYVYDSIKERRLRGETVRVLKWARDVPVGGRITGADVMDVGISTREMKALEGVMRADERSSLQDTTVSRSVNKNEFVRYRDIYQQFGPRPSDNITEGKLAITLPVDPYHTPGAMLRVNDRVDVIALLSIKGKPAEAYRLIENLRVVAVGGEPENPEEQLGGARARRTNPALRTYRSITVEVTPEVATQLAGLLPRVRGKLWLGVRNRTDRKAKYDNRLNPDILEVLKERLPETLM